MGFIDDAMKGINDTINEIKDKSQEVMSSISLNNRLNSLEGKKTAILINVGQLIYDKYEKGDEVSEDLLKEKVKEIASLEREIVLTRSELEGLRPASDAPRSEKAAHASGYKPTPGFVCPHCQAQANIGKAFCVACGGSLKEASEAFTSSAAGNGHSSS
jgi:hypothetical protein